jgi:hypothetical protein
MPTVSDTLLTILKLQGGPAYASQLGLAAKSVEGVAVAETAAAQGANVLKQGFNSLGGSTALLLGEIGAVVLAAQQAVQTFAQDEAQIFRTTIVLRNLGNSLPIEKVQAFAAELQKTVAIDDEAVVSLVGMEKRFGVADNQIEATTKTIVDFSKATGIDLAQAGEVVGRAMLGQTRGLRALGIQMTDTGDKSKNLAIIQTKLNALFGGAGAAERNTVAGSFTALKESLSNLLSAIGDKLSVVIVPAINALTSALDLLVQHIPIVTAALGALIGARFGPIGALVGGLAGLGLGLLPGRANAAQAIGTGKEKLATEETLSRIEKNTAQLSPLIAQVIGGTGEVARRAVSFRDTRMAFGI